MVVLDVPRLLDIIFFFFKQKTAYEMRISDWSSDVCSSDLTAPGWGMLQTLPCPRRRMGPVLAARRPLRARAGNQPRLVHPLLRLPREIGRASCRERGCQYV